MLLLRVFFGTEKQKGVLEEKNVAQTEMVGDSPLA